MPIFFRWLFGGYIVAIGVPILLACTQFYSGGMLGIAAGLIVVMVFFWMVLPFVLVSALLCWGLYAKVILRFFPPGVLRLLITSGTGGIVGLALVAVVIPGWEVHHWTALVGGATAGVLVDGREEWSGGQWWAIAGAGCVTATLLTFITS